MLAQYDKIYQFYNQQCRETDMPNKIAMQNRGNLYLTGYRCLVNFCTAYHRNQVDGYRFTSSAALIAQDWGKRQQPKTIRRHLIRLSAVTELETEIAPKDSLTLGITLFTRITEFKKGFFKNVHLWVDPAFVVFNDPKLQAEHAEQYPIPIWKPPPKQAKPLAGADQPRTARTADGDASKVLSNQIADRLSNRFRVNRKGK